MSNRRIGDNPTGTDQIRPSLGDYKNSTNPRSVPLEAKIIYRAYASSRSSRKLEGIHDDPFNASDWDNGINNIAIGWSTIDRSNSANSISNPTSRKVFV
jgi:hypothetical protein